MTSEQRSIGKKKSYSHQEEESPGQRKCKGPGVRDWYPVNKIGQTKDLGIMVTQLDCAIALWKAHITHI